MRAYLSSFTGAEEVCAEGDTETQARRRVVRAWVARYGKQRKPFMLWIELGTRTILDHERWAEIIKSEL